MLAWRGGVGVVLCVLLCSFANNMLVKHIDSAVMASSSGEEKKKGIGKRLLKKKLVAGDASTHSYKQ